MALIRISGILATMLTGLLWMIWGPWHDSFVVQAGLLAILLFWHRNRFSWAETVAVLKLVTPFVLTMLAIGGIFQYFVVFGRSDWIRDSALKVVLFPNSLLVLALGLSYISYRDILGLPLPGDWKRDIIVFRATMEESGTSLTRLRRILEWSPGFRAMPGWKRIFKRYGALVLALFLHVLNETEQTALVLENRVRHLGGDRKEE
ncbi:MAG: hypothetical protein EOM25_04725 [Deltaproteobacteria bacterium]|nr:hypothetical protein [Deltaproteobacteria bacterium]